MILCDWGCKKCFLTRRGVMTSNSALRGSEITPHYQVSRQRAPSVAKIHIAEYHTRRIR
jgi:hypothetical protein